jgi:hypothetical protein
MPVRPPKPWPYASRACWEEWRGDLETRVQAPNLGQLKREADHELARIARILEGRWQPKRAGLVPPRPGDGYRGGR